jgi:tetratricopeptide (TPR) repeat protein
MWCRYPSDGVSLRRGNLYFEAQQYQLAIVDYQDAVDMSPDESGYFNLGQAYLRTGQLELALDAFRQTTRLNSNHLPAYQRLGEVALQLNHLNTASEAFSRELKLQEEEANLAGQMVAHLNLGRAYRRLGNRRQEAQRQLREAADLAGKLADDLVFTFASFEMGLVSFEEDRMEEAAEHFATAAELFDVLGQPQRSVETGLYLARALNAQSKTAEATQALDDAESRLNAVFDQTKPEDVRLKNELNGLRQTIPA